jgi:adenylate cyclase, class 2
MRTSQELEVKFYLSGVRELEKRILAAGGRLKKPRRHELNLRFDSPDGILERSHQVLRLRKDDRTHLTYKGPGTDQNGARLRQELEIGIDDFETARQLLEALGYQVSVMYEKYRTEYFFEGVEVTLDELPYGLFSEIEGPDGATIQAAAQRLGLDWETRILDSYLNLFKRACKALRFKFRDLSFENFSGLEVKAADLGVREAI